MDYYDLLGISRDASDSDIKSAYRKQAMKYHPDRNPGDSQAEEKFKEVTKAYEVLIDQEQRQIYDIYGEEGVSGGGFGGQRAYHDFSDIFGDIFADFFGGGGFSYNSSSDINRPRVGSDIRVQVDLTFKEAMEGTSKEISFKREGDCSVCDGEKTTSPESKKTCPTCEGTGSVRHVANSFLGQVIQQTTCPDCDGHGQIIEEPCESCQGSGRQISRKSLKINIPKGVDNGNVMNLRGEGNAGQNGGMPGSLIVYINVEEDEYFKRQGDDLFIDIPITYSDAVLGGKIKIPTLTEIKEEKIKKGTESGTVIRLRGYGAPIVNTDRRGDLHARLNINVPKNVTDEERDLLEKLQNIQGGDLEDEEKGIFDRIRDFFHDK